MSDAVKPRAKRKAQTCFGRVKVILENQPYWFEQRKDGVYVRRLYARKWHRVAFDVIRDYGIGQFPLSLTTN